jgi:hypothetical protein
LTQMSMPSSPNENRELSVQVVDRSGALIPHSKVEFRINGIKGGTVSGTGRAEIEIANSSAAITIMASVGAHTQRANLAAAVTSHRFVFDFTPAPATPMQAVAICPDGTSGSPCVRCRLPNGSVKICC